MTIQASSARGCFPPFFFLMWRVIFPISVSVSIFRVCGKFDFLYAIYPSTISFRRVEEDRCPNVRALGIAHWYWIS